MCILNVSDDLLALLHHISNIEWCFGVVWPLSIVRLWFWGLFIWSRLMPCTEVVIGSEPVRVYMGCLEGKLGKPVRSTRSVNPYSQNLCTFFSIQHTMVNKGKVGEMQVCCTECILYGHAMGVSCAHRASAAFSKWPVPHKQLDCDVTAHYDRSPRTSQLTLCLQILHHTLPTCMTMVHSTFMVFDVARRAVRELKDRSALPYWWRVCFSLWPSNSKTCSANTGQLPIQMQVTEALTNKYHGHISRLTVS